MPASVCKTTPLLQPGVLCFGLLQDGNVTVAVSSQSEFRLCPSRRTRPTIVIAHLLVNMAHGLAHRELRVGLPPSGSVFVILVVLILPLVAMVLVWTVKKRLSLHLLSLSMFGSLLFGAYHHFLVVSPDHIHSQPASLWGIAFILTAYGLLITEAIGT